MHSGVLFLSRAKKAIHFVIALNLRIVVFCFSSELRKLFQIYDPLSIWSSKYLFVLILWIGCIKLSLENLVG